MRTKLGQNVEEMLERDNVLGKLDQLREITSKTQQPPGHQAPRTKLSRNILEHP